MITLGWPTAAVPHLCGSQSGKRRLHERSVTRLTVRVLQGRGGSTGYDNAVALPARSDSEELAKENNKSTKPLKGQIVFSVAKVRHVLGV